MQPVKKRIHSCYDKSKEQVWDIHHNSLYELGCSEALMRGYTLQNIIWVRVAGDVINSIEGRLFDAAR
jgi:hypothetical protein